MMIERKRRSSSRRGFAMIFVLILITLAAALLTTVTVSVGQLAKIGRQESYEMQLRQMIDSGAAWAQVNRNEWPQEAGVHAVIRLSGVDIIPMIEDATIVLTRIADVGFDVGTVRITATLTRASGQVQRRSSTVTLPSLAN